MRLSRLAAGLLTVGLVGVTPVVLSAPANAAALGSVTTLSVSAPFGGSPYFNVGDTLSFTANVVGSDGTSRATTGTASLQVQTAAAPTFTTISIDTTPSSLFFSGITAQANANYKVVFSGGTSGSGTTANTYTASESAPVAVQVAREIKARTSGLKVIGKVLPNYAKQKVTILRKVGKKYKKYDTVKTNGKGRFTFKAPSRNGFKFSVLIPGDALYAPTSAEYTVRKF